MSYIVNPANVITCARFAFAIGMVLSAPFSAAFWVFYLCGGLSDVLDGMIARKLDCQSAKGAKLDSIADAFFSLAICVVVVINISIPVWLWFCASAVAALRLISYGIGFYKYRAFAPLHTYANKICGMTVFAFPILYALLGMTAACIITLSIAFVSSVEELVITISSKELDRDRKSLLKR